MPRHSSKIRWLDSWARFTRARLLPTAWSNLLVGACIATPDLLDPFRVAIGLICTSALYAFGMGLNDYADRDRDAKLYPERPIPCGALSTRGARYGLGALAVVALIGLAWLGRTSLIAGGVLLLAILAYDLVTKDHPIVGPICMGTVRGALLALGATLARPNDPLSIECGLAASVVAAYVAFLTRYSLEEERNDAAALSRRFKEIAIAIVGGVVAVASSTPHEQSVARIALWWLIPAAWFSTYARAPIAMGSRRPGLTTYRLLLGLFPLDMALALSYDSPRMAVTSFALGLLCWRPTPFPRLT